MDSEGAVRGKADRGDPLDLPCVEDIKGVVLLEDLVLSRASVMLAEWSAFTGVYDGKESSKCSEGATELSLSASENTTEYDRCSSTPGLALLPSRDGCVS